MTTMEVPADSDRGQCVLSPSMQAAGRPAEPRGRHHEAQDPPEPPAEPTAPNSVLCSQRHGGSLSGSCSLAAVTTAVSGSVCPCRSQCDIREPGLLLSSMVFPNKNYLYPFNRCYKVPPAETPTRTFQRLKQPHVPPQSVHVRMSMGGVGGSQSSPLAAVEKCTGSQADS
jgi:hypothetical protein